MLSVRWQQREGLSEVLEEVDEVRGPGGGGELVLPAPTLGSPCDGRKSGLSASSHI